MNGDETPKDNFEIDCELVSMCVVNTLPQETKTADCIIIDENTRFEPAFLNSNDFLVK